jgi:DNA (cytosine-5)-methyltransferase 1
MTLTVGSLFSGIGGIDLGLERAGMRVVWQSEIDPYACRVLAKNWPTVPNLGDVTTIDWSTVERPDVICGGYPCQPFSLAGARRGEHDPRHLWPHMLRALRELRPRYALLENVPGHLSLGFGRVLGDLAEIGFDAEWDCIPAAAVGAPHLRDRVFIVAHPHADGRGLEVGPQFDGRPVPHPADRHPRRGRAHGLRDEVAHADHGRCHGRPRALGPVGWAEPADGRWWATEPDVGRVAHGVPARVDRLRALGNAVVPQVAEHVGRLIVRARS